MASEENKRIYLVNGPGGAQHLVNATNKATAIRHVVSGKYFAEVATTKEVAKLVSAGTQVEQTSTDD